MLLFNSYSGFNPDSPDNYDTTITHQVWYHSIEFIKINPIKGLLIFCKIQIFSAILSSWAKKKACLLWKCRVWPAVPCSGCGMRPARGCPSSWRDCHGAACCWRGRTLRGCSNCRQWSGRRSHFPGHLSGLPRRESERGEVLMIFPLIFPSHSHKLNQKIY